LVDLSKKKEHWLKKDWPHTYAKKGKYKREKERMNQIELAT